MVHLFLKWSANSNSQAIGRDQVANFLADQQPDIICFLLMNINDEEMLTMLLGVLLLQCTDKINSVANADQWKNNDQDALAIT